MEIPMATKKPAAKAAVVKKARVKVTGFAPMKIKEFTITQKSSGRYEVVNAKGDNVNGADKVSILTEAKLLKPSEPKAAPEAATEAPAAN
jgi:hypothetical protein